MSRFEEEDREYLARAHGLELPPPSVVLVLTWAYRGWGEVVGRSGPFLRVRPYNRAAVTQMSAMLSDGTIEASPDWVYSVAALLKARRIDVHYVQGGPALLAWTAEETGERLAPVRLRTGPPERTITLSSWERVFSLTLHTTAFSSNCDP